MKITPQHHSVNPKGELLLCFDVSKATLNLFSQYHSNGSTFRIEDEIANRTDAIEHVLARCKDIAEEASLSALRVLAESTGGYEQKLLKTARRLGHKTALISPEHVAQLKKVESNDTGKTDHKDPRVMHLVARLGKAQRHRHLPETYRNVRRLTSYYDDDEEVTCSAVRQRIHALILELFPDYDKNAAFTFSATGTALMQAYAFDPFAICRAGYKRFEGKIKRRSKYTHFDTLGHLFACAERSARYHLSSDEVDLLTTRLKRLWADYERHTSGMKALKAQIEALGEDLKEQGALPRLDEDVSGVTLFNMARLLGQTGPLGDFPSKRALLRYAGLNIRERKSGQYRGHNRISKKGRSLLRKVLNGSSVIHTDDLSAREAHPYLRRLLPREATQGHAQAKGEGGRHAEVPLHGLLASPERRALRPTTLSDVSEPVPTPASSIAMLLAGPPLLPLTDDYDEPAEDLLELPAPKRADTNRSLLSSIVT